MPARIAETRAMLSFLLRPGTEGTVMLGVGAATESPALTESGLIAAVDGFAVTATGAIRGVGDWSMGGDVFVSLAAQATTMVALLSTSKTDLMFIGVDGQAGVPKSNGIPLLV